MILRSHVHRIMIIVALTFIVLELSCFHAPPLHVSKGYIANFGDEKKSQNTHTKEQTHLQRLSVTASSLCCI